MKKMEVDGNMTIPDVLSNVETMDIWQLTRYLYDEETHQTIDPHIAKKLFEPKDAYYLKYIASNSIDKLPITKAKLQLVLNTVLDKDPIEWNAIIGLQDWLEIPIKKRIVEIWLSGLSSPPSYWIYGISVFLAKDNNLGVKVLDKIVSEHKERKRLRMIRYIKQIFVELDAQCVEQGCEILMKSTPSIRACLLDRTDTPEKYTTKALKALGKLSGQRELKMKVDFDSLKNLAPRERLNTIKQLLGMFDCYYQSMAHYKTNKDKAYNGDYYYQQYKKRYESYGKQKEPAFKEFPKREELEQFLFPCSMKYNNEVVKLMERYDEIVANINNKKEKENDTK